MQDNYLSVPLGASRRFSICYGSKKTIIDPHPSSTTLYCMPCTHRHLFSSAPEPDFNLDATVQRDIDVLNALQAHVKGLCNRHQEMRDWVHRETLYPNLAEAARKMGTDVFTIPGNMISYKGERWLLLDTTGSPNQPMTAHIQQATHADAVTEKVVRYDTMKPPAIMREQHLCQAASWS